jgi:hypothetical protein
VNILIVGIGVQGTKRKKLLKNKKVVDIMCIMDSKEKDIYNYFI